jgi:hypothetical protein
MAEHLVELVEVLLVLHQGRAGQVVEVLDLCRHRRSESCGQCRDHARAPAADQGRAGHRQDRSRAAEVARALNAPLIEWHIKSTTKAQQGLYEYDAVARLRDSQLGDPRVSDIKNYIKRGKLWEAFTSTKRPVLLIDEIDKADIEFPNDLLLELDRMEFHVYETGETIKAAQAPDHHHHLEQRKGTAGRVPAPLLLPLHQVPRPRDDAGSRSSRCIYPGIKQQLVAEALRIFFEHPRSAGPEEEALDLRTARLAQAADGRGHPPETLRERDPKKLIPPLHGALLKNEQDVHLFEQLAFLAIRSLQRDGLKPGHVIFTC